MSRENRLHYKGCDCFICAPGETMSDLLRYGCWSELMRAVEHGIAIFQDYEAGKFKDAGGYEGYRAHLEAAMSERAKKLDAYLAPPPDLRVDANGNECSADPCADHGSHYSIPAPPPDRNDLLGVGRAQSQHDAGGSRSSPAAVPSTTKD